MGLFSPSWHKPNSLNVCICVDKLPILARAAKHGFLWPIAKGLAERGHKVTILSWRNPLGKKEIIEGNVRAFFLGEGLFRDPDAFPKMIEEKFRELHAEEPFDIVHSVDPSGFTLARRKKDYNFAVAFDVEATHMPEIFALLGIIPEHLRGQIFSGLHVAWTFVKYFLLRDRRILSVSDGVFVTSPQQRLALERYYLYPDQRTYTIPYGIEITNMEQREQSESLRQKLNLPGNAHTVVTISDMQRVDEMVHILRAFEKVAIKKPSARLIVVGNGPMQKDIEREMLMLALGSKVIFTGAVRNTEIPDYIALSDIFINISSRSSGFEPSLLEAMAQKKVIIGSEVSPISTIVDDGVDGFLVRPADTLTMSTLMIQIFNGLIGVEAMGGRARKKVTEIFDLQHMVTQTLNAYFDIMKNSSQVHFRRPTAPTKAAASLKSN